MSKSKDKIDKIDEQIKNLMNEEKAVYEENEDDGKEVIVEKKYAYDDVKTSSGSTKKLDVIEDALVDSSDEDTKKLDAISDIEEKNDDEKTEDNGDNEEVFEDKTDLEEDVPIQEKKESTNDENEIDVDFADVKKGNGIIWIVLSIGIVVILVIALALFMLFGNEKKEKTKTDTDVKETMSKSEQKEIINKYGDALKGVVAMNIEKENKLLLYDDATKLIDFEYKVECSVHEIYENGNIYLNKCMIDDVKTSYSYGEKQVEEKEELVEDDDSIKVYVSNKNGEATLNEPKNIDEYEVFNFNIDGKYSNLTLLNNDSDYVFYYDEDNNVQMKNYKKDRKALSPMNYTSILPIKYDGMYDSNVVAVLSNGKWGLYNLDSRERIVGHRYESVSINLNGGVSGPPLYIDAIEKGKIAVVEDGDVGVINYNNGSEIIPIRYSSIIKSGNYLWLREEDNSGHIFDFSGKEYLNDSYDEVYGIVDGAYVLVKDGDDLKLVKVNGKTYFNYGEVEHGDYSYGMKYKDGAIFQFYKIDSNDSCIEVIYDNGNKTGEVKDITCGAIDISK